MSNRKCKKCGSTELVVRWHDVWKQAFDGQEPKYDSYPYAKRPEHEHLAVCCRVCGFRWTETTLDKQNEGGAK